ncbi:MAG: hypothetical protein KAU29_08060 [Gammaproteobacteria bacterium]|nr:hypothetical protein [Gammaproteobacteria bacterium]
MEHTFNEDVEWFSNQVGSRKRLLPTFAHAASLLTKHVNDDLDKFIDQHAFDKVYEEEELSEYAVPIEYATRHRLLISAFRESIIFADLLPKMTLVSLISVFDAYLSRLLRTLFTVKPEILNGSDKQLTFSQLTEFGTINDAREHMINCEIESLIRDNHSKQFDWLEKKLGTNLRKNLPSWKNFIEITGRRNLLVHSDGIVNSQYITNCKNSQYPLDESLSIGDKLSVDPDYYKAACDYIAEIGIKLNQVMWRKLLPSDAEQADSSIISVSYNLLLRSDYHLAEEILMFATTPPFKCSSGENSLYLKINLAIALKSQEKYEECENLIQSVDWSALSDMFKLASYVLTDNFDEASATMRRIGNTGRPKKIEYANWPLFKWFRKTDQFKTAYEDIFGEPFKIVTHTETKEELEGNESSNKQLH